MARKQNTIQNDERSKLIDALKFVGIATQGEEGKNEFVSFGAHLLRASNDTFTLGIPVGVDLELCPRGEQFKSALEQCGSEFKLTQIEKTSISVKSGAFRAVIQALEVDQLDQMAPDPPCGQLTGTLRDAFIACLRVMSKGERHIHNALLLRANTLTATNGGMALQYWHGIDLPGRLNIPKKTADIISKIAKPLSQFGFTANSFTIYFDDMAFLKTRLMHDEYPDVDRLFIAPGNTFVPIWPEFYKGIDAISAFVEHDRVFFNAGILSTHDLAEQGASYLVEGLPNCGVFNPAYWKAVQPYIEYVAMNTKELDPVTFMCKNARGLLMGRTRG